VARARAQVHAERATVERLRANHEWEERALGDQAFASFIATVPVAELENYPGIGRATITKLRDAGFADLARLGNVRIRVSGLGAKRLAEIDFAVRDLLKQATHRFNSGACQEASSLSGRLNALRAQYQESKGRAEIRAKVAESIIEGIRDLTGVARQVTFLRYFWKDSYELVAPQMMHVALPNLQTALDAAGGSLAVAQVGRGQSTSDTDPQSRIATAWRAPQDRGHRQPAARATSAGTSPRIATARAEALPEALPAGHPPRGPAQAAVPAERLRTEKLPDLHLLIMELTIEFTFAVARLDGPVTTREREIIEAQVAGRYKHDPALLNRAKAFCAHYESAAIDLDTCVGQIAKLFAPAHRSALLNSAAIMIVQASGGISHQAFAFLAALSRRLDVPLSAPPAAKPSALRSQPLDKVPEKPATAGRHSGSHQPGDIKPAPPVQTQAPPMPPRSHPSTDEPMKARAPQQKSPPRPTPADYMRALEIEPSTRLSGDLIRRQFNLLCGRYAAEKFDAMGLEFVAVAQSKRTAIREAAAALLEPLGEKLEQPAPGIVQPELRHNPDLDDVFGV
jgi:hypothetical protein